MASLTPWYTPEWDEDEADDPVEGPDCVCCD